MPGPDNQEERGGVQLHDGLFWGGVGLAPIAALLLLLGREGGPLRIAAVLAILAVVLIGLSITLRSSSDTVRVELEETLYEEVDALRKDVREDITTAARATHRAFGEKLQALYEQVTALRAQLDALRAEAGRGGYDASSTMAAPPPAHAAAGAPAPAAGAGSWSAGTGSWSPGAGSWSGGTRAAAPPGVVRHTETVQVTTRQTIVDPAADEPERGGTVYGGGSVYGRHGRDEEAGWADQRQWGAEPRRSRRRERGEEPAVDDGWSGVRAGDRWASVRDDDRGREVRMGERRAAVQSDDHGTEMRIEDRWAAVRREEARRAEGWRDAEREGWRDDAGRWEDTGRRGADRGWRPAQGGWRGGEQSAGWGREETGWRGGEQSAGRGREETGWRGGEQAAGRGREETGWRTGGAAGWGRDDGRRDAPAALPAGGVASAGIWDGDWAEAEREPVGGWRHRGDDASYRYAPEPEDRWR